MAFRFRQLTDQLWSIQSELFYTNHGIFISEGRACLIDPGITPDTLVHIARFVARKVAAPTVLVLTHAHWDHVLGPEHFEDVTIVAHANYLDVIDRREKEILGQIARWEAQQGVQRARPFTLPYPDRTFVTETDLDVGTLTLELKHAPGHAPDQLVVYAPESGTLWAADMLSDVEIPLVSHSLAAYARTLDMLASLDIHTLIPGHGASTQNAAEIRRRLEADRAYLDELHRRIRSVIAVGRSLEDAVARCADIIFRHPEENATAHRRNVESAYVELGGRAADSPVGWGQDG